MDDLARGEVAKQLEAVGALAAEFMPSGASAEDVTLTAIWLIGHTLSYHHARALILNANPQSQLTLEDIAKHITRLTLNGLGQQAA